MSRVVAPKESSAKKPAGAPAPEAQSEKKSALRGQSFDAQEQLLAPGDPKVPAAIAFNEKQPFASTSVDSIQGLVKSKPSGAWDAPTVEGVMAFQRTKGLGDDGKVGRETTAAMKKALGEEGKDDDKKVASKEKPKAEVPALVVGQSPKASAGAQAPVGAGSASGRLKKEALVAAQSRHRDNPFAPEWVAKLQAAIGAPVTMVLDPETLQKIADYQDSVGQKVTGVLRTDTLKSMLAAFPELAQAKGSEHKRESTAKGAGEKSDASEVYEDQAVREKADKGGIAAYTAGFQRMTFLGSTVVGRPDFLARIGAAKAYLMAKFKTSDAEVAKQVGCSVSNSYRPSSPSQPQAYHGIGHAFDIDHDKNPWVVGNPQAKTANDFTTKILAYATAFMGSGESFDAKTLHKWAQELTTEELYAKLEATNVSLRSYREMAKDPDAIRAQFDKRMKGKNPLTGEQANVEFWLQKVPSHHAMLLGEKSNWHGKTGNLGIMNQSKDVVVALRDVAGLRWGATDMGDKQSSDMMHWDNDHDSTAHAIWKRTKDLRDAAKPVEKRK